MKKQKQLISVVAADDHPIVLNGLVQLMQQDKNFKLVGSFTNGAETLDAIRAHRPDIALVDINMPKLNGIEVLKAVTAERLPTRIIFLAAAPSDKEIVAAVTEGAFGIVLKEAAPDTLINCLRTVTAGQTCMPAQLVSEALKRTRQQEAQVDEIAQRLTNREMQVILKVAEGLSNKEVGRQLNISEGTVKLHLHSVYGKVGVNNRTSLVNFAIAYRDHLSELNKPGSDTRA